MMKTEDLDYGTNTNPNPTEPEEAIELAKKKTKTPWKIKRILICIDCKTTTDREFPQQIRCRKCGNLRNTSNKKDLKELVEIALEHFSDEEAKNLREDYPNFSAVLKADKAQGYQACYKIIETVRKKAEGE